MAYETLKKEVIGLPDDKLDLLIDFARFLKQEFSGMRESGIKSDGIDKAREREIGFMAEDFVSIAPDFDDCIEGLEDYI